MEKKREMGKGINGMKRGVEMRKKPREKRRDKKKPKSWRKKVRKLTNRGEEDEEGKKK